VVITGLVVMILGVIVPALRRIVRPR
jgi:hypothetical protein